MGRITPSFRQLYGETISDLRTELQAALVALSHKSAFDLLLKVHNAHESNTEEAFSYDKVKIQRNDT